MVITKKKLIYLIISIVIISVLSFSFLPIFQSQREAVYIGFLKKLGRPTQILEEQKFYREGLLLYKEHKCQKVIEEYQEFLSRYPDAFQTDGTLFLIGQCQKRLGNNDEALLVFQKLIDNYPESSAIPNILYRSAEIYFIRGELKKTEEYCDKILEEYPDAEKWIINVIKKLKLQTKL